MARIFQLLSFSFGSVLASALVYGYFLCLSLFYKVVLQRWGGDRFLNSFAVLCGLMRVTFRIGLGGGPLFRWKMVSNAQHKDISVKRLFDLMLALGAAVVLALPLAVVALMVRLTSRGPALYWSDRVGRDNHIFKMPKFRSMRVGTPAVATHLLANPASHLTPIGSFLRGSSLDELPQLWSILVGDMSFVGPRPALFNQADLIEQRTALGVHRLVPGLTGWAQVNGRDELPIPQKVELDAYYAQHQSLALDLRVIWMTFVKVLRRDGVSH